MKYYFLLATFSLFFITYSQQSINSSGGEANGSGGTVSYSIGQTVYSSYSGNGGSIEQGVQHAYTVEDVGITNPILTISMNVFPNPTTDKITLDIQSYNQEDLQFELYDFNGKLLQSGDIMDAQTRVDMYGLQTATYLLHIRYKNQTVKSFKIIKS